MSGPPAWRRHGSCGSKMVDVASIRRGFVKHILEGVGSVNSHERFDGVSCCDSFLSRGLLIQSLIIKICKVQNSKKGAQVRPDQL